MNKENNGKEKERKNKIVKDIDRLRETDEDTKNNTISIIEIGRDRDINK